MIWAGSPSWASHGRGSGAKTRSGAQWELGSVGPWSGREFGDASWYTHKTISIAFLQGISEKLAVRRIDRITDCMGHLLTYQQLQ